MCQGLASSVRSGQRFELLPPVPLRRFEVQFWPGSLQNVQVSQAGLLRDFRCLVLALNLFACQRRAWPPQVPSAHARGKMEFGWVGENKHNGSLGQLGSLQVWSQMRVNSAAHPGPAHACAHLAHFDAALFSPWPPQRTCSPELRNSAQDSLLCLARVAPAGGSWRW